MPFVRMPADFVSEISRFGFPQNQVRLSRRLESPPKGKWGIQDRCERSRQCGLAELLARPMLGSVRAPDAPQYYIPKSAPQSAQRCWQSARELPAAGSLTSRSRWTVQRMLPVNPS